MLKWIKALGVAAILAFPMALPVGATDDDSKTVVTNTTDQLLNAVDETTSSLNALPFELLSVFISGTYAAGNTVVLQREVGSPGSGAFETVATVTTATANERIEFQWTNGPNTNAYRLKMTATGTGAVVAYLTNWPVTAVNFFDNSHLGTHFVDFYDFVHNNQEASTTVLDAEIWLTTEASDDGGNGTVGANVDANREGIITMISDTEDTNPVCVSYIVLANFAALVSDGVTAFEVRVNWSDDDGWVSMGMNDDICATNDPDWLNIDAEVASEGTDNGDVIGWVQDAGATDVAFYQAISAIATVVGANALSVPVETMIPASYDVLRVETDSSGNGYFYLNGVLRHAEPLAVGTAAEILPFVMHGGNGAGTTVSSIDYWLFANPRPTTPST